MMSAIAQYPDWKAPPTDSAILLWPNSDEILRQTSANHALLGGAASLIQNVPLRELREAQRTALGIEAQRQVLGTGHQAELYHAGVWSKLALLHAAGRRASLDTLLLAVDTDAPKHLALRWPGGSERITDDPSITTASWSGLLAGPTPSHLNHIEASLRTAIDGGSPGTGWPFEPMALPFLDELRRQSLQQPSLPASLVEAMHKIDWSLGLRHQAMLVSPMCLATPYLLLAYHVMAKADEFAASYNRALAGYRRRHRIRTAARPMPDLHVAPDLCEVPFWLDDLKKFTRRRAQVQRSEDGWRLVVEGGGLVLSPRMMGWDAAAELQAFLRRHALRLSPRALTLTLFARLLVVDNFVHGIGGGRYDQVTDAVIGDFVGIAPPHFSVTTATLYFPTALDQPRVCLPCLALEGHRLRHSLLERREKETFLAGIEAAPRRSAQRQQLFGQMHARLAAAERTDRRVEQWRQRVEQANRDFSEQEALFDRELFYAIQPRSRLEAMIAGYEREFSG